MNNESKPYTDDDLCPFGMHQGKRMRDVPAGWLIWAGDNVMPTDRARARLLLYVHENRKVLEAEVEEEKE